MTAPHEKLADSLDALQAAASGGVVRASALSRTHRERLLRNGFLQKVVKGWLITTNPTDADGSSTAWYAAYWAFVAKYLQERFANDYCLSPEASVLRHVESGTVPRQIVVITISGSNQVVQLPFTTSLLLHRSVDGLPEPRVQRDNLWLMDLPAALCKVSPALFQSFPDEAEIALRMTGGAAAVLPWLLTEGAVAAAGRLSGAYGFLGENTSRNRIIQAMSAAGFAVRPANPFNREAPALPSGDRPRSPHAARVTALWNRMRRDVIALFPEPPGLPSDASDYLAKVDERYASDAYNSLSIEGYQVSPSLIARVREGMWDPSRSPADLRTRDALAARGYFQAFGAVKDSVASILSGAPAGDTVERDHTSWFQEMFAPPVQAGILPAALLAGYRSTPVFLRGSRHVPAPPSALLDCMEAFFASLKAEEHPAVRAVLGHFVFVYVHPYPDGNGRIGRFLMNALLASGGYPWTVIRLARRQPYMDALESASVDGDIRPFTLFLREEMEASLDAA